MSDGPFKIRRGKELRDTLRAFPNEWKQFEAEVKSLRRKLSAIESEEFDSLYSALFPAEQEALTKKDSYEDLLTKSFQYKKFSHLLRRAGDVERAEKFKLKADNLEDLANKIKRSE